MDSSSSLLSLGRVAAGSWVGGKGEENLRVFSHGLQQALRRLLSNGEGENRIEASNGVNNLNR